MSTGLHAAREDLHLPNVSPNPAYNQSENNAPQPKSLSLSPRTFGMEDLRDFCGPLGSFKTGLTPRVFNTGLTPRSGFTPRFTTGFTPRVNGSEPNSFFGRFSPPRQNDNVSKISPTGFTPKDVSGMKVPMRFPQTFTSTPMKMEQLMNAPPHQVHKMHQSMSHMSQPHHHPEMNHMNAAMYDYMNRPNMSQHHNHHNRQPQLGQKAAVSPVSDENEGDEPEDLDERRRMKNRERVRKCRKRKQDRLNYLEDRTNDLEKENNMLKAKLARKADGNKGEPLTEAQVNEVRKKQNTTLAAYVRAYNESSDDGFAVAANSIWSENTEIVYGNNGISMAGLNMVISNKQAAASVFEQFKIKNYSVQWKEYSHEKCLVHWDIDVVIKPNAPRNVPFTMPFADLGSFFAPGEVITIPMNSHVTFEDGKIVEEVRQLNLANLSETVLSKFADEPTKAASVLRCLMNA